MSVEPGLSMHAYQINLEESLHVTQGRAEKASGTNMEKTKEYQLTRETQKHLGINK